MNKIKKYITFVNEGEEMKQKYYIYTLSDPIDGEVKYVGKTKNMKERLIRHMEPSNFKNAWTSKTKWILWLKSQGLKPMIEILDEGDAENIDALEIYWISQLKQWGYKLKNNSNGGPNPVYWTGKKLSDEHKMKTRMNNPRRKDICEYEIGTDKLLAEYDSIVVASRETGHKPETIAYSCKGKTIPGKHGVYWGYKENYFPYVERDLKHTSEDLVKMKMNHPMRRTICQYEIGTDKLIKEWDSSHDVERETGIKRSHVIKCCKGIKNYNTAGDYYWRYKENYFPFEAPSNSPIKIEQYDENWNLIKIYKSTYELRKDLKIDIRSIIKYNFNYKGYNWKIKK